MTHTYVTVDQFVEIVQQQEAIELSDLFDGGNTEINTARVLAALVDASREADSYFRQRYTTPVTPTPPELKRPIVAIARYRLSNLADKESRIRVDYDDSIRWLQQIAKGLANLDLVAGDSPVAPETQVFVSPGYRMDLEGFHV